MDMNWWVADALKDGGYVYLLSWIFWVIFSICLHELGHGWAALAQGDDTPRATGHMTMNPLVHMGQTSLIMFAIIGIAWGAMPVNPHHFRDGRFGDAKVSAAGPVMNLLLALISLTGLGAFIAVTGGVAAGSAGDNFAQFLWLGGLLNIALMLLNLLPIPPLDGSTILRSLVPSTERIYSHPTFSQIGMMVVVAVIWFGSEYLWRAASVAANWWSGVVIHTLT